MSMDEDPIFPPGMPEEFKDEVRNQLQRQEMKSVDINHSVSTFINELTDDQLQALETLLLLCMHNEHAAQYYVGIVSGVALQKFNRCAYCRVNHEEEFTTKYGSEGDQT